MDDSQGETDLAGLVGPAGLTGLFELVGLVGWFLAFLPDALAKEYPHAYVKVCS